MSEQPYKQPYGLPGNSFAPISIPVEPPRRLEDGIEMDQSTLGLIERRTGHPARPGDILEMTVPGIISRRVTLREDGLWYPIEPE